MIKRLESTPFYYSIRQQLIIYFADPNTCSFMDVLTNMQRISFKAHLVATKTRGGDFTPPFGIDFVVKYV